MISDKLLPPFIVGETYLDRDGEYKVIAVAGDKLTIERADGSRAVQDVALKARIHRGVLADLNQNSGGAPVKQDRHGLTIERDRMITLLLQFEADGADHSGIEIDRHLREAARDLGYSEQDLAELHTGSNRGVFANDGDWAKAVVTTDRLHQVVDRVSYLDASGKRRECQVYRITPTGLDELRRRVARD